MNYILDETLDDIKTKGEDAVANVSVIDESKRSLLTEFVWQVRETVRAVHELLNGDYKHMRLCTGRNEKDIADLKDKIVTQETFGETVDAYIKNKMLWSIPIIACLVGLIWGLFNHSIQQYVVTQQKSITIQQQFNKEQKQFNKKIEAYITGRAEKEGRLLEKVEKLEEWQRSMQQRTHKE